MTDIEIYLTIMVTVLVATQVIRIVQNTLSLRRNRIIMEAQIGQLQDITNDDINTQRKAYSMIVDYLEWFNRYKNAAAASMDELLKYDFTNEGHTTC